MRLKAIILDVDGTIAETEEAHRRAFNQAFAEAGQEWAWSRDDYRRLLKVTGGRERIRAFVDSIGAHATDEAIAQIHRRKNALYSFQVAEGAAPLRPGVARLIDEAHAASVRLAIATTTSAVNLEALIDACFGREAMSWFDAIVTGEDVRAKKPDPEVYAKALNRLALPASACVAIEDSRNGLEAASACGIATLVTPSFYTSDERFDGAAMVRESLDGPPVIGLDALDALLADAALARAS